MWIVLVWFIFAIVVGVAANGRGRSGFGWFLLAVILSPLLAGLLVAILPDLRTRAFLHELVEGRGAVDDRTLDRNVRRAKR